MNVTAVPPSSAAPADEMVAAKARKAGAQFEGILLNMVLGDLERAFTALPGRSEDAVNKSYSGFAMETLTSGLAERGGVGVGAFIARSLIAHTRRQGQSI
ncbi:MAG TPA: hypothetical protein VFA85_02555 [Terriglobales bacterium]|nr:hypothetical protein [Terriglobales bacterium]